MTDSGIAPSDVLGHAGITLLSLLVGVVIGGLLGAATGFGLRPLYSASPGLRSVLIFFPWRTALALCLTVSSTIVLVFLMLSLGAQSASTVVGTSLTVALIVWVMIASVLVENRNPSKLPVKLIASVRTVAVLTVVIVAVIGQYGTSSAGLGALLYRNVMTMFRMEASLPVLLYIALIALVMDLLFGVLQLIAALSGRRSGQDSATQDSATE